MIKLKVAHVPEDPASSLSQSLVRIDEEIRIYNFVRKLEESGIPIMRQPDNLYPRGMTFYALFKTEEEAALFRLTYL